MMINRLSMNRLRLVLRVSFGISLLAALFFIVDFKQLITAIARADALLAIAGMLVFLAMSVVEGFRLQVALSRFGLGGVEAQLLHFSGVLFSNFLPGNVGSEFFKGWYINRAHGEIAVPAALMTLLRISSLLTIAVLFLAYLLFASGAVEVLERLGVVQIDVVLIAIVIVGLFLVMTGGMLLDKYRLNGRFSAVLERMWDAIREISYGRTLAIILLSFVVNMLRACAFYIAAHSFGIEISILDSFLLISVAVLATSLPISFSGLGLREGALVGALLLMGSPAGEALGCALLLRGFMLVAASFGWVSYTVLIRHEKRTGMQGVTR